MATGRKTKSAHAAVSIEKRAKQALDYASGLVARGLTWLEFSNSLFGIGGTLTQLFPTEAERHAFCKTKQFRAICEMLDNARDEQGDPPGPMADALGNANGTAIVRMPKSLHAALITEAEAEGISLNQLCVSKLAFQLGALVGTE